MHLSHQKNNKEREKKKKLTHDFVSNHSKRSQLGQMKKQIFLIHDTNNCTYTPFTHKQESA